MLLKVFFISESPFLVKWLKTCRQIVCKFKTRIDKEIFSRKINSKLAGCKVKWGFILGFIYKKSKFNIPRHPPASAPSGTAAPGLGGCNDKIKTGWVRGGARVRTGVRVGVWVGIWAGVCIELGVGAMWVAVDGVGF